MIKQSIVARKLLLAAKASALLIFAVATVQARPAVDDVMVASIPSPNQEFNDEFSSGVSDLERMSNIATIPTRSLANANYGAQQAEPSNENSIPIYVSPFARSDQSATGTTSSAQPATFESRQESSHAPPNYAPRPSGSAPADLKTSASYGHHHGNHGGYHHGGYGPSGWLDMGAWTGGKGSFGWYADYPVGGGKHHYGK